MGNSNLNAARMSRCDEFYTLYGDVLDELRHYSAGYFRGRVVYCNCDDWRCSSFVRYFREHFAELGLSCLLSTCYGREALWYAYDGVSECHGVLRGDGDFRSPECVERLKRSDIVVTNPPFSLFRAYVAQLMGYGKRFLIIGNMNCVTYKEVFPLIMEGRMWSGVGFNKSLVYGTPYVNTSAKNAEMVKRKGYDPSKGYVIVPAICWFTNLEISKRHEELILWKHYTPEEYPKYDNYDAIHVGKTSEIPCDYDGVMGVPISFLDKYNPEQFEILGLTSGRDEFEVWPCKRYINAIQVNPDGTKVSGSKANTRATLLLDRTPPGIYYTADNADGPMEVVYVRILIRRKR